jgi:hypothetical protein
MFFEGGIKLMTPVGKLSAVSLKFSFVYSIYMRVFG